MPIACIGRDLRVLRPSSSHLHQPSATLLATRPLPLHLHLKRGRDLVPLRLPRGRPDSTASRRHAVTARCLPRCPHGRELRAAGRSNSTRLPQKAVTAVPAPSLPSHRKPLLRCPHLRCLLTESASSAAHHQAMYTCPPPALLRLVAAEAEPRLCRSPLAAICTHCPRGPWAYVEVPQNRL